MIYKRLRTKDSNLNDWIDFGLAYLTVFFLATIINWAGIGLHVPIHVQPLPWHNVWERVTPPTPELRAVEKMMKEDNPWLSRQEELFILGAIWRWSGKYRRNPLQVVAQIHIESRFHIQALSRCGALGLMQLMPRTAKLLGVIDRRSIEDNIRGGIKHMAYLTSRYGEHRGLGAYNCGHPNDWPEETVAYVQAIERGYQKMITPGKPPIKSIQRARKAPSVYVVRPGDTLSAIGYRFGKSVKELLKMNSDKITDPDVIYPGEELELPWKTSR